jgi:hypothetical protein
VPVLALFRQCTGLRTKLLARSARLLGGKALLLLSLVLDAVEP